MGVGGAVWLGLVMFSVEAQEISKGQRGQLKKTAELRGETGSLECKGLSAGGTARPGQKDIRDSTKQ